MYNLRRAFTNHRKCRLELCTDQFVIGTKDVDTPVTLSILPEMECKITCRINRSAIASAQHITVSKTFVRQIKIHHLPVVMCLGKSFDSCKNILHIAIPEEGSLTNEPIVMYIHCSKSLFDTLSANIH